MSRPLNHRTTKLFLAFFLLAGLILPACTFTCRSMAKEKAPSHECCHKKEVNSAKLSQPPCCELCRTQAASPAALSSAPAPSFELFSMVQTPLPSANIFFKKTVEGNPENHAPSPPLYLSFKTLLC